MADELRLSIEKLIYGGDGLAHADGNTVFVPYVLPGEEVRANAKSKKKRTPKTVLKLPDLEQSKSAVLNSLPSPSSQRSYDHAIREFIDWYCSEPRLAFNKTVVTRYRISLEQRHYAPSTINLRLAAVRRLAYEASDCGLLSPDLAAGIAESNIRFTPAQVFGILIARIDKRKAVLEWLRLSKSLKSK